uniref:Phospholipid-binding protein, PBP family n=1 Tax=Candidatus Kentrum sp. TUN TaxID=2126343 RepID=A0A450Z9F7_9GAMM|nr:MAG: phospholipid-binding protein, PBP family [Candidatus Kentron sp. TUN]VFK51434.1 MAG: phospholipid-binding protein, PBP family [Candidatus Kentron sp. TUN]VFK62700.1 MAG: phospholipid-binding protein, PBP family [Candidatus Kentron sp. TUN]
MKINCANFGNNQSIPGEYAFCIPDPKDHITFGNNKNPALSWNDVPGDVKSFVLICHDSDVPGKPDDVNQEGRTIPSDLPRVDFYHWILVDIPTDMMEIKAGEYSNSVTARGKKGPETLHGTRQGINNYTQWFSGDADMEGQYFGYDGPCPPWNDSIVHHYHFTLYAIDLARCPVEGTFDGDAVKKAIEGHILAETSIVGTYSLNPNL